jgi:hypothetical protein
MLFAEYRSAHLDQESLTLAAVRQSPPRPADTPAQQAGHVQEWVATILARPLFNLSRQPPPSAAARGSGPTELGRLTGVLIDNSEKRAMFAPDRGKPIVAEEGSRIGPYQLRAIEPGRVTIIGPDGTRVLQPAYEPNARQTGIPAGALQPAPANALRSVPLQLSPQKPVEPGIAR